MVKNNKIIIWRIYLSVEVLEGEHRVAQQEAADRLGKAVAEVLRHQVLGAAVGHERLDQPHLQKPAKRYSLIMFL